LWGFFWWGIFLVSTSGGSCGTFLFSPKKPRPPLASPDCLDFPGSTTGRQQLVFKKCLLFPLVLPALCISSGVVVSFQIASALILCGFDGTFFSGCPSLLPFSSDFLPFFLFRERSPLPFLSLLFAQRMQGPQVPHSFFWSDSLDHSCQKYSPSFILEFRALFFGKKCPFW